MTTRCFTKYAVVVLFLALLVLIPHQSYAQTDSVLVRYGHTAGGNIDVDLNQRVSIPVYVYTGTHNNVGDLHFVLGFNDQYIDSILSETEGSFSYPLDEWDAIYFSEPFSSPPNPEGWSSQSMFGWARLSPESEAPWLLTVGIQQVATYVVKTSSDQINIGDIAIALGPGLNPVHGGSNAGDTVGGLGYRVVESFAHFTFVGGGYIEGTITDYQNNPIEGIMITCRESGKVAFSDDNGFYSMGHYPGTFNFEFSNPDYVPTETEQIITLDQTVNYDVSMDMYGVITGTVTNYNDVPIPDVEVTAGENIAVTGENGVYTMSGLLPGSYDLTFAHADYVQMTETGIAADYNTTTQFDMVMHQLAGITGRVTDMDDGTALGGIIVTLYGTDKIDTTNANGYYNLPDVSPAVYDSIFFDDPTNTRDDSTLTNITVNYDVFTQLNVQLHDHVGINDSNPLPVAFNLSQNYPNPFNANTTIEYALEQDANVHLDIFDVLGRKVATLVDEYQSVGQHKAVWNASAFTSGMYFYKLQAGDKVEQKSMMLLK